MDGISVIICCHNSELRLPETLRHLSRQRLSSGIPWEVIVVDNNSSDETRSTARSLWNTLGSRVLLSVVDEPRQGLTFARHTGFANARFDILVLCDDDNWLGERYLETVYEIFHRSPGVGVIGGCGTPQFEDPDAACGSEDRLAAYATGPQSTDSDDITEKKSCVYGAGMAMRKAIVTQLQDASYKFLLSDRSGNTLGAGGDTELCLLSVILGHRVWYDKQLTFQHFIPGARLTPAYRERLVLGFNSAGQTLRTYYQPFLSCKFEQPGYTTYLKYLHDFCHLILFQAGISRERSVYYRNRFIYRFSVKCLADDQMKAIMGINRLGRRVKRPAASEP